MRVSDASSHYNGRKSPARDADNDTLGFTIDTLVSIVRSTIFNPYLTLPLALLARYTAAGQELAAERPKSAKALLAFLAIGLLGKARGVLDRGVVNNWTNDTYDWKKEIVVVTGGSDGIGAKVVRFLAERGIKVVVLDIQPLKFDCEYTMVSTFSADCTD